MKAECREIKSNDFTLSLRVWIPEESAVYKGCLQLIHGMAEHIDRYDEFATFMTSQGFVVWGQDLRGHGRTASLNKQVYGFFTESDGWKQVLKDIHQVNGLMRSSYPDLPVFMLGHSMGSFFLRDYLAEWPDEEIAGAIISGTGYTSPFMASLMQFLAKTAGKKRGWDTPVPLLHKLSFEAYNKQFKPNRTGSDWLSRDTDIVDAADKDPLCGFISTAELYYEVAFGLKQIINPDRLSRIKSSLPLLFYSGDQDPVGQKGKGVDKVIFLMKQQGKDNIQKIFLSGGRHECLNEINRKDVYQEILGWMSKVSIRK